jgi:hypothetical protein
MCRRAEDPLQCWLGCWIRAGLSALLANSSGDRLFHIVEDNGVDRPQRHLDDESRDRSAI